MISILRNRSATSRGWLPLAGEIAALAAMLLGLPSTARPHPGRWSPSADWSGGYEKNYAVHLVLLPGDGNPYHSRVLWWMGQRADTMWGGQWGWTPGGEGRATFPTTNFADLGLAKPGMDIFRGGHIQMPDLGRLLVIGGTDTMTGDFGENRVRIFTPGTGTASGSWSSPQSMKNWRWYSGSVALRDGRLVAMSGDMHRRHSIFGGRTSLSQCVALRGGLRARGRARVRRGDLAARGVVQPPRRCRGDAHRERQRERDAGRTGHAAARFLGPAPYRRAGAPILPRGRGVPRGSPALRARAAAIAKPAVPARFALHQNRPNPFHAGTTIHFDLPAGAMVRLEVFDVLGRRVRRLAHRWYPPGFHGVEWDARNADVYFYRIQAGANRDGRKMLLTQ